MASERERRPTLAPKFPLRALIIEDNAVDAELCIEFLSVAQFEVTVDVTHTPKEFVQYLQTGSYDVILADYNLGSWTGMDAFDLLREEGCDIPFILLTAALGDATAVECMKRGIADYVLKDRLERLPVSIYRALEQKATSNERRRSERTVDETEAKFRALADMSNEAVFIEQGGRCTYVNRAAEIITGYRRSELLQVTFWQLIPEEFRRSVYGQQFHQPRSAEGPVRCQTQIATKSRGTAWVDCAVRVLQIEGKLGALISVSPAHKDRDEEASAPAKGINLSDSRASEESLRELALAVSAA
jgi:PAS domain S-box-containing protein